LRVGGVRGGYEGTQGIGGAPVVDGQGGHGDAVVETEGGESVIGVLAAGDDAVPGGGEPEVFEGGAVLGGEGSMVVGLPSRVDLRVPPVWDAPGLYPSPASWTMRAS
jgi:hypothetical protein